MEGNIENYPKLNEGISALKDKLKNLELPLMNVVIPVLVFGFKQGANKLIFHCPQMNHKIYSLLFIIAPSLVFFCFALMLSKSFWKVMSGCCRLPKEQRQTIWKRSRKYVYLCTLPPVAWLLFVFLDTEYYVCYRLGPTEVRFNQTYPLEKPIIYAADLPSTKAESQIIAFLLLIAVTILATVAISIERCCTKVGSDIDNKEEYMQYLEDEEKHLFNSKLKTLAKEHAKEELEAHFEKYKDVSDPEERILFISQELEKRFP